MKKIKFGFLTLFFSGLMFLLSASSVLWARGGGAGGGHSGGGGGGHFGGGSFGGGSYYGNGGVGYTNYGTDESGSNFLWHLILFGVVGWIFYQVYVRSSQNVPDYNGNTALPIAVENPVPVVLPNGESSEEIKRKAVLAFMAVQLSWSQKRLDTMRRFITDGVYQRFHAQFTMMNLLEQQNPVTDVRVNQIHLSRYERDGNYDVIELRIVAEATDQFFCQKFPNLNSPGGHEGFTEYWSFIRRVDYKRGSDIFHSELCPKCAAPLSTQLIETARCPYCNTYLNSGEYDWVLSQITQKEDYGALARGQASGMLAKEHLASQVRQVREAWPLFSLNVLQDKASNAFMQILIGEMTKDLAALKRFTTADLFAKLQAELPPNHVAYNRLYTRRIDFLGAQCNGNQIEATVGVCYSLHEIDLETARRSLPPPEDLPPENKVLVLIRNLNEKAQLGSIYAGSCPNCGAAASDSLSSACGYCGATFNDPDLDWIVKKILDSPN